MSKCWPVKKNNVREKKQCRGNENINAQRKIIRKNVELEKVDLKFEGKKSRIELENTSEHTGTEAIWSNSRSGKKSICGERVWK